MSKKIYLAIAGMLFAAITASAADSSLLQALVHYQQYKAVTEGQVLGIMDFNTNTSALMGCNFNSICEPQLYETQYTCPSDCMPTPPPPPVPPAPVCNYNKVCEPNLGETLANCYSDCYVPPVPVCNNNLVCEPSRGETLANCYSDCYVPPAIPTTTPPQATSTPPVVCNYNLVCEPSRGETLANCYSDCYVAPTPPTTPTSTPPAPVCNYNKICEPSRGETLANCYSDCYVAPAPVCNYNKVCETARGENSNNCLYDCPLAKATSTNPCNYNKVCEPTRGENYLNCVYDCPKPTTSIGSPIKYVSPTQASGQSNNVLNSFFDIYTEISIESRNNKGLGGLELKFLDAIDSLVDQYKRLPETASNIAKFNAAKNSILAIYRSQVKGDLSLNSFFDIFTDENILLEGKKRATRGGAVGGGGNGRDRREIEGGGKSTSTPPVKPPSQGGEGKGPKTNSADSFFDIYADMPLSVGTDKKAGENKVNSFFDIYTEITIDSKKKPISGPSSFFDVYLEMADKKPANGENKVNSFFDIFTEIDTASAKKGPDCAKDVNDNVNQARFEAFNTYTKMVNEALVQRWAAERNAYNISSSVARDNALQQAEKAYKAAEYSAKNGLDSANSFINLQEVKLDNYCK